MVKWIHLKFSYSMNFDPTGNHFRCFSCNYVIYPYNDSPTSILYICIFTVEIFRKNIVKARALNV